MLTKIAAAGYRIEYVSHARAILSVDFPAALDELDRALAELSIPIRELVGGGGGEAKLTQRLRSALAATGWTKHKFEITKFIDRIERQSISHEVDHVRRFETGIVALEIEWNNKDPFFDRDLENFKRLHAEGAISVGVIVTRGTDLQDALEDRIRDFAIAHDVRSYDDLGAFGVSPTQRQRAAVQSRMRNGSVSFPEAWAAVFCDDKYGQATTHWRKLEDRVRRGVGNPCPLLLVGIPSSALRT